MGSALGGEDETDRVGEALPGGDFVSERAPSGGGEPVVLGAPAVLGGVPLRDDPPALLEPDQRRVDGALAYLERVPGKLLDAVGETPPMHGRERERLEDEQVEGSLQDLLIARGLGHRSLL